jgi:hypothetical protein
MLSQRGGYMKTVPYTTSTGIKIGCRYGEQGKRAPINDRDMILIQEALLATPEYIRQKHIYNTSVAFSILGLLILVLGVFLTS